MVIGGSIAILLGATLFIFTGVEGVLLVAGVFLAIGLVGVWMGDRRRQEGETVSELALRPGLSGARVQQYLRG